MEDHESEDIAMGQTKEEKATKKTHRQEAILKYLETHGGVTGNTLSEIHGVTRGTILRDIAELRRKGYPIQVSSHVEESGMLVAVYELPKYRPRS